MSWKWSFCIEIIGCSSFADLYIQFLPQVWKVHSYYIFNSLPPSLSLFLSTLITLFSFLIESDSTHRVSSLLKILVFSPFLTESFVKSYLPTHLYFLPSYLLFNAFFISFYDFFSSKICFCLFVSF